VILAFRHEEQAVVEQLLLKVVNELVSMLFTDQDGRDVQPEIRCGLALMPADGGSIHELLEAADRKLRNSPTLSANIG
jgi:hypothetical protein